MAFQHVGQCLTHRLLFRPALQHEVIPPGGAPHPPRQRSLGLSRRPPLLLHRRHVGAPWRHKEVHAGKRVLAVPAAGGGASSATSADSVVPAHHSPCLFQVEYDRVKLLEKSYRQISTGTGRSMHAKFLVRLHPVGKSPKYRRLEITEIFFNWSD